MPGRPANAACGMAIRTAARTMKRPSIGSQNRSNSDPGFALAYGGLAVAYIFNHGAGWPDNPDQMVEEMWLSGQKAIALEPRNARGHMGMGWAHLCRGPF